MGIRDFQSLRARLDDIRQDAADAGIRASKRAALAAHAVLVSETRIDTSNARSNWIVSTGAPSDEQRGPFVPGAGGSTLAPSTSAALDDGRDRIDAARPGETIFIAQGINAPYIPFITPPVARAVSEGVRAARATRVVRVTGASDG